MDEVKDWLTELSIGDAYPVRDYGCEETARLAKKCLTILRDQELVKPIISNMRHKNVCPLCGELKYLHGKIVPGGKAFVPSAMWLCDDCDKPIEVHVDYSKGDDNNVLLSKMWN